MIPWVQRGIDMVEARPLPSCAGYLALANGEIMNARTGRILKPRWSGGNEGDPYFAVEICGRNRYVHLLVLEAFKGQRDSTEFEGHHKDGDHANNRLSNLEWLEKIENRKKNGRKK